MNNGTFEPYFYPDDLPCSECGVRADEHDDADADHSFDGVRQDDLDSSEPTSRAEMEQP